MLGERIVTLDAVKRADLIRAEFVRDFVAPLPASYDEGYGAFTVTDTSNNLTINGGSIRMAAGVTSDPLFMSTATFARAQGRALIERFNRLGGAFGADLGMGGAIPTNYAFNIGTAGAISVRSSGSAALGLGLPALAANTWYDLIIIQQSTGAYFFIRGGVYLVPTLVFVDTFSVATNLKMGFRDVGTTTGPAAIDFIRYFDLAGMFGTFDGLATLSKTNPITATNYPGDADGITAINLTLPGAPVAGDGVHMKYRVFGAGDYMDASILYNNGTGKFDFSLDSYVAGVPTNRIAVADVGATNISMEVRHAGASHDCFTCIGGMWLKRGATITDSNQAGQTNQNATFTNVTVSALKSYAYVSPFYYPLMLKGLF